VIAEQFKGCKFVIDQKGSKQPISSARFDKDDLISKVKTKSTGWYITDYEGANDYITRGYNVSLYLTQSGMVCVDIDSSEALATAQSYGLPDTLTEDSLKGTHYWYLLPDGIGDYRQWHSRDVQGLELKCSAHSKVKVTIAPSVVEGKEYKVTRNVPIAEAPQWVIDTLCPTRKPDTQDTFLSNDFWYDLASTYESNPDSDRAFIRHILERIDSDMEYPEWYAIIRSVLNVYGQDHRDEAKELLRVWSEQYSDYNPSEFEAKINSTETGQYPDDIGAFINRVKEHIGIDTFEALKDEYIGQREKQEMTDYKATLQDNMFNGFVSLADIDESKIPPIQFIVDSIMPEGVTLLSGDAKIGKTWLALDIAIQVASGLDKVIGEYSTTKGNVLYLDFENGLRRMVQRTKGICNDLGVPLPSNLYVLDYSADNAYWNIAEDRGERAHAKIEAMLNSEQGRDIKLIVIDTLSGIMKGKQKIESYELVNLIQPLERIAQKYHIGILLLHHNGKGNEYTRGSQHKILGSVGIEGSVGTMWILYREDEQDRERAAINIVSRDTDHTKPINLQWNGDSLRFTVTESHSKQAYDKLTENQHKVYLLITKHSEGIHYADIHKDTGISKSNLSKVLRRLEGMDLISECIEKPKYYRALNIEDQEW
jgi:sugar-specific transcriptional regulator TrmB